MFIAVNPASPKRLDLMNDGRYAMHGLPGKPRGNQGDDEFYMTGRSVLIEGADRRIAVESAGHTVHPEDWVFELAPEYVMTAYWENLGKPDTYAVRREWRAGESS
jgi:hypothetical protein